MKGKKVVGLGPKLITILDKIIQRELARGCDFKSYCQAGELLAKRIENSGGLRE